MTEEGNTSWLRIVAYVVVACLAIVTLLAIMAPDTALLGIAMIQKRVFEQQGGRVTLASAGAAGSYYEVGHHLRDTLSMQRSLRIDVVETDGSVENVKMLQDGRATVALIQGGLRIPKPGITALANIDREYAHIVVPVDSSVQTFRDLAGLRIFTGMEESGSSDLARTLLNTVAFSPQPQIVHGATGDVREWLDTDKADAALLVYRLRAMAMNNLLSTGLYRLVPIPESPTIERFTTGCFADYIPHSVYGPNHGLPPLEEGPVPTLAVNMVLAAHESAPGGAVRAVLEGIYTPVFRRVANAPHLTEAYGRQPGELPFHDTAERYYGRNDPLTADSFEIASFFIAMFLFGASGYQYLSTRKRKQVSESRRLAIIPYFESMVTFGNAVENSNDTEQLTAILHNMMASQRRAEEEWLKGHLDTEHMENLYSVYSTRSRNAFSKIMKLHLVDLKDRQSNVEALLKELIAAQAKPGESPKPKPRESQKPTKKSDPLPEIVLPPPDSKP